MLLSVAGEDIERPDEIRTAVKVIQCVYVVEDLFLKS